MAPTNVLLKGYKRFYDKHFQQGCTLFKDLAENGQAPKTLIIACSDSRVDPAILLDTTPGQIFVVRNVANLVPPYQPSGDSYHGTSAALEFAVNYIKVENIVVLGHSKCAGIQALVDQSTKPKNPRDFSFISSWVDMASHAREEALEKHKNHKDGDVYHICEKESIITSLKNLETFPWVQTKVAKNELTLHGWYVSLVDGKLHMLSSGGVFEEYCE